MKRDVKVIAKSGMIMKLVKVLMGEKRGTAKEIKNLNRIKEKWGDRIYCEAIYIFTHTLIDRPEKAKELIKKISQHRFLLNKLLGRDIGVKVAALDYMQNNEHILVDPIFIERKKIRKIVKEAIKDDYLWEYDKEMFYSNLKDEIARARRYGSHLSVIMIEVEDFKKINDEYGHVIGGIVLKNLADTLVKNIRKIDSVYRYDGDEFVVLLPETTLQSAERISEKIVKLCEKIKVDEMDDYIGIRIGIASFYTIKYKNSKGFICDAIKVLHAATRKCKNKIIKITGHGYDIIYNHQ